MTVMMDYIMAGIIFGILAFTTARVQINLNGSLDQNTTSVITQRNAVELARQIENDFLKIGYRVRGQKIYHADSTSIQFRVGYLTGSALDTPQVKYFIGTRDSALSTPNPDDYPIYKQYNSSQWLRLNYGITSFRMRYYNENQREITTPSDSLANIRSIFVQFYLQSPVSIISYADTSYSGIGWQKRMIPRNLN